MKKLIEIRIFYACAFLLKFSESQVGENPGGARPAIPPDPLGHEGCAAAANVELMCS